MASQNIDIIIQAKDQASKSINGIRGTLWGLKTTVASVAKWLAIAQTAIAWVWLFWVRSAAQIEQTRVAFENLYGSAEQAWKMMKNLSDFAKKTPFEFGELSDVALKLKNVAWIGDEELIPMLTNLWDIAASQAKPISQIVEAYNDAITGEFERLKEFGIKARQEGDNVTFTFKWQEQTVKKTSESIGEYLQSIGQAEGITGAMDKQSETLNGRLSTMKDQFKWLAMALVWVSETGEIIAGGVFDRISIAVAGLWTWLETNQEQIIWYMWLVTSIITWSIKLFRDFFKALWDWLQAIKEAFNDSLSAIQGFFAKYWDMITIIMSSIIWLYLPAIVSMTVATVTNLATQWVAWSIITAKTVSSTTIIAIQSIPKIIAAFALMWYQSLIHAAKVAAAWVISMWPIAWVTAAVVWVATAIFLNWDKISEKTTELWKHIYDVWFNIWVDIHKSVESIQSDTISLSEHIYKTWFDIWVSLHQLISWSMTSAKELFIWIWEEIYIWFSWWITSLVDSIKEKLDAVMNFVSDKVAQAKKILSNIASAAKEAVGNAASKVSSAVGARASGGAVTQNRAYLVGENWPELFVPRTSGSVQASGSNQSINISLWNVNVYNEADENRLVLKIKQELTRTMQLQRLGIS